VVVRGQYQGIGVAGVRFDLLGNGGRIHAVEGMDATAHPQLVHGELVAAKTPRQFLVEVDGGRLHQDGHVEPARGRRVDHAVDLQPLGGFQHAGLRPLADASPAVEHPVHGGGADAGGCGKVDDAGFLLWHGT
jgi:hypothetical protein